nr:prophage MuMc02 [uncultured Mediterranean phage uvMED]
MAGIKDYSTTQANNTSLNGISTAEGMLPSNLNNAIRALMKNTRDWYNDSQWVEYGDGSGAYTAAYASATSFTIAGVDVTSFYHADRRIKVIAPTPGTIYGTISSSSFSTDTTVNVTWDSGNLSNEAITNVFVAALSKTNTSIPGGVIGTTQLADGSVTTAKIAADAVNGSKIADDSIDSEHYVDGSIDTAHIADSQITVAKMAANSVDSDQYVDGSIDTIHIADSQITNPKMAANSVDSDQYVDGSIDTAHIGDSQVTTAKIADSNITSAKILDGTIVNADINASAAIDATKIHDGTISNTEFGYLNGVTSAIQTQVDSKLTASSNLSDVSSASTARTNLGLGTIATQDANNVSISGGAVTGLGSPSASSDAATKNYVDQAVAGLRTRVIAEAATTANIDLTADLQNGDTLDGVTLVTGDRVLVKDQTDATANGLYIVVASGTASRDPQFDTIAELSGQMIVVNQGTANDNKIFLCTTDSDATIGVSNITYTQVTPANVGTVTSVGVADSGSSEFTVTGSPITSSGTINLAVNSIANTKITGLGTAATLNVGTSANNVVQLDGSAKLPAVDGSQLTNIDAASAGFAIAMAIAL